MKKIFYLLIIVLVSYQAFGQSKEELRNAKSVLWLGLDFTETRFEGRFDFGAPNELSQKLIPAWNQVMLAEPEKFDIANLFHFSKVETDFGIVFNRNESVNEDEIFLNPIEINEYSLTEEKIQEIVSDYKLDYEGYALVFIVESYSKRSVKGNIWVTFFHIPTKKVVFTKKMTGEARGFGIKNYWTGAVYDVMKQCNERIDYMLKD